MAPWSDSPQLHQLNFSQVFFLTRCSLCMLQLQLWPSWPGVHSSLLDEQAKHGAKFGSSKYSKTLMTSKRHGQTSAQLEKVQWCIGGTISYSLRNSPGILGPWQQKTLWKTFHFLGQTVGLRSWHWGGQAWPYFRSLGGSAACHVWPGQAHCTCFTCLGTAGASQKTSGLQASSSRSFCKLDVLRRAAGEKHIAIFHSFRVCSPLPSKNNS